MKHMKWIAFARVWICNLLNRSAPVLIAAVVLACFLSSSGSSLMELDPPMVYRHRDSTAEEVIDFLSEDAIRVCLAYHIFEEPVQVFDLPFEEDRVRFFSSAIMCFRLTDGYHIYVRSDFSDGEMSIVNDEMAERVSIPLELCPSIWEQLIQRDM